ncbi:MULTISPECIES: homoserine O-succinyltransferase [Gammaproteobacteria]|uniref:homoserine O-acetyltransferase/O-succinyltransferase family protein n=1 Tax=Gammaproteobacteria TaxID=1236 RepID=UPI000DCF767C|nr:MULTISPECIES: homoserine O-succinyltransferase [Gammaproteobacteria]RTE87367.1 hypothetical protein DQX04_02990 [Aliidiomarina sp. B3213]TCZ92847.1 hypothetical protein EYQ95_02315 [Lysobacter sp. N42]
MRPTLAFLNLMPNKIDTERQWLKLVEPTRNNINWQPFITESYQPKSTDISLLLPRYCVGKPAQFDALIITGAPLGRTPYQDVKYWGELAALFDFCIEHRIPMFCSCWAANAYLYAKYQLTPNIRSEKLFGVFEHKQSQHHPVLNGLEPSIWLPQSRYAFIDPDEIKQHEHIEPLLEVPNEGPAMLIDQHETLLLLAHPEYAEDTLQNEYKRDQRSGLATKPPVWQKPSPNSETSNQLPYWQLNGRTILENWLQFALRSR